MPEESTPNIPITVHLCEPWDLGKKIDWKPLPAVIVRFGIIEDEHYEVPPEGALLKLSEPIDLDGVTCEYFIASPRYEGEGFDLLAGVGKINCGIHSISPEDAEPGVPLSEKKWKEGVLAIATLIARKK